MLPSARADGVCIPVGVFKKNIDTFVSHTYLRRHRLTREATSDYLRQRGRRSTCRFVKCLNAFVRASIDLHELHVDCCRKGCDAFTAARKTLTACENVCGATRLKTDGTPAKQVVYWRLASWLRMLFADPSIGPGMVRAVARAPEAAGGYGPINGVRDVFDGDVFRDICATGQIDSNIFAHLGSSTDGFKPGDNKATKVSL